MKDVCWRLVQKSDEDSPKEDTIQSISYVQDVEMEETKAVPS